MQQTIDSAVIQGLEKNRRGQRRVWCLATNAWIWRHPIDIREGFARGTIAIAPPEGTQAPEPPASPEAAHLQSLQKLSLGNLRALADRRHIEHQGMTKIALVTALHAAGVEVPGQSEGIE